MAAESENKTNVIIVGGGPAGLSAATVLARAGFEPIVIESLEERIVYIFFCVPLKYSPC